MARMNVPTLHDIQRSDDFRPFRQCDNCNGSCKALLEPGVIRELLKGQEIQLFRGSAPQIRRNALQGCELAKLLEGMLSLEVPPWAQRDVAFFLHASRLREDGKGRRDWRLLSLQKTDSVPPGGRSSRDRYQGEARDHLVLQMVTGPGMEFRSVGYLD